MTTIAATAASEQKNPPQKYATAYPLEWMRTKTSSGDQKRNSPTGGRQRETKTTVSQMRLQTQMCYCLKLRCAGHSSTTPSAAPKALQASECS
eukprot:10025890-Prorocentrum_lima.AAC.1